MPFTEAKLQKLARKAAKKALIDDCIIERISLNNGQISSTVNETVKCIAVPATSGSSFVQSGMIEDYSGNLMTWRVTLPLGTQVQEMDVLTIKGQRMTVQRALTPKSYAVFDEIEASGARV